MSKQAPATKADKLNSLYKECGLVKEDVFGHQHYTIITRSGIEKVAAHYGITITYKALRLEPKYAVIKATATMKDAVVETYGSAVPDNCRNNYFAETAEKRALSRAVLKLTGLYQHGFFGEEESEQLTAEARAAPQHTAVVKQDDLQAVPAREYASAAQKEEIIRLLNHPVITRQEKTKMLLCLSRLDEERATAAIDKLNAAIAEREAAPAA